MAPSRASPDQGSSSSSSRSSLVNSPSLSPPLAQTIVSASVAHAESISCPVNIWVLDPFLHPLAFYRMEGAKLTSIDIAFNKAFTAAGHRAATDSYGMRTAPGGVIDGIGRSNGGRFCTIAGGEPVLVDGACLGGVGVSGGTPAQDKEIALAGIARVQGSLQLSTGTTIRSKL